MQYINLNLIELMVMHLKCHTIVNDILFVGTNHGYLYKIENLTSLINEISSSEYFETTGKVQLKFNQRDTQIANLRSTIRNLQRLDENSILISLESGCLWSINIRDNKLSEIYDFDQTIWCSLVLNPEEIVVSGKYGYHTTIHYNHQIKEWVEGQDLHYSRDAIFVLDFVDENTFVTNNYFGNNKIRQWNNDRTYENIQIKRSAGNMQHAVKVDQGIFAAIFRDGSLKIFEYKDTTDLVWTTEGFEKKKIKAFKVIENFQLSSSEGTAITFGNGMICGSTKTEIMIIDSQTLEIFQIAIGGESIEWIDDKILLVMSDQLLLINPQIKVNIKSQTVFEYKIGILGASSVGKTRLSYYLQNDIIRDFKTSYGR